MLPIPNDVAAAFMAVLHKRNVPLSRHSVYKKWLCYFLDFRSKYHPPESKSERATVHRQLKSKGQSTENRTQAAHAVSLYFESQRQREVRPVYEKKSVSLTQAEPDNDQITASLPRRRDRYNEWRCLDKTDSPVWGQYYRESGGGDQGAAIFQENTENVR